MQAEFVCAVFAQPIQIENAKRTQKIIFDHTLPLRLTATHSKEIRKLRNALMKQAPGSNT